MDWVYLAQNKDLLRGLVKAVMNLRVRETSRQAKLFLPYQGRVYSITFIINIIIAIIGSTRQRTG
jgi:hypothetical protein